MTIKINGKEYKFAFQSQVGVNYKYEVIFGSQYADDINKVSSSMLVIRLAYAILSLCNHHLDITFDDFLEYITLEDIEEMGNYVSEQFAIINQEKSNNQVESEEDGEKKD